LRRLAYGVMTDKSRVDDVLQEAFIRAYRKLPERFESERQEAAWLYRIVYRCCLNELRSTRRRLDLPAELDVEVAAASTEPSESMWVAGALAELPADQRAVVLLVDLLGFDYETAASVLRAPRGTIAWRLNIARTRLRHLLEEDIRE
ncbi:MAG: RNA polymerase sigma factor, partial [Gaiellaceae bacterium]